MEMPIFKCIFATSQICLGEEKGPRRVTKDSLLPYGSRGNVDSASKSQQLSCTRRRGALAEKISHTTPTWVCAWELMQCSMSGRQSMLQGSSSKNFIKSLHPSGGSRGALTLLKGCGTSFGTFFSVRVVHKYPFACQRWPLTYGKIELAANLEVL